MISIAKNKKFFTTAELKKMGYSYYIIRKITEDGILKKVNRNTYENLFSREKKMTFLAPRRLSLRVSFV